MATKLAITGCVQLTEKILANLQQLIQYAMSIDYGNAKKRAKQIEYDAQNLINFIPANLIPQWLQDVSEKCGVFSNLNVSTQDYGKHAMVINNILFNIQNFSWGEWNSQFDHINLDKEFAEEAAAAHLDEAIDRLIACLNIIANTPEFNLGKQVKIDIETLVEHLAQSKHASQSAIKTWLYTAAELVKLFIPHMDKIEKGMELLKQTEAAFNEACGIIDIATRRATEKIKEQFCSAEKILPSAAKMPKLLLLAATENEDKQ